MTQEENSLLLKDLCARLPYGVKVQVYDNRYTPTTLTKIDVKKKECIFNFNVPVEYCIPYLRPMSSITEEEKEYIKNRWCYGDWIDIHDFLNNYKIDAVDAHYFTDWLNSHHFDYHGLIEKGLALEAPEGMYQAS